MNRFAGMSVKERTQTAELLKRICKGRSVIVIEHDMDFVEKIAEKVTVLHQGKMLAEGPMSEIKKTMKMWWRFILAIKLPLNCR